MARLIGLYDQALYKLFRENLSLSYLAPTGQLPRAGAETRYYTPELVESVLWINFCGHGHGK